MFMDNDKYYKKERESISRKIVKHSSRHNLRLRIRSDQRWNTRLELKEEDQSCFHVL